MPTTEEANYSEDVLDRAASTRLHLSGVDTPIMTCVTQQSERGMTVEQVLPFLRLQTQVWDQEARSSRIESVRVVVQDGMPRLVLDLAFDDDAQAAQPQAAQPQAASVAPATALVKAHRGVVRPRARIDETVPFDVHRAAAPRAPKPVPIPAEVAGLSLSAMEQELVKPRDLVYRARCAWERAEPKLRSAWAHTRRISIIVARRSAPVIAKAAVTARVVLMQHVVPALVRLAARVRTKLLSRRALAPR